MITASWIKVGLKPYLYLLLLGLGYGEAPGKGKVDRAGAYRGLTLLQQGTVPNQSATPLGKNGNVPGYIRGDSGMWRLGSTTGVLEHECPKQLHRRIANVAVTERQSRR